MPVTKRLVDIDDQVLENARGVLGTHTIKDTVGEALRRAVAADARRRHVEALAGGGLPDLGDPLVMAGAWR